MAIAALGFTAFETAIVATSVAATAASTTLALEASSRQATAAAQAANYNAKVDQANAQQIAMNANANIEKQRQDDQAYQSNQRAALASSGVLSDTGSSMQLEATTAGRQEQDIQTYWASVQEKESQLYASAQEGVYEGQEQADIYHLQGAADIFSGIGSVASTFGRMAAPTAAAASTSGNGLF